MKMSVQLFAPQQLRPPQSSLLGTNSSHRALHNVYLRRKAIHQWRTSSGFVWAHIRTKGWRTSMLNGTLLICKNPTTNEVIADVSVAQQEDVDRAVAAAQKAQPSWAATPAYLRARVLRKFADLVHQHTTKIQEVGLSKHTCCRGFPINTRMPTARLCEHGKTRRLGRG